MLTPPSAANLAGSASLSITNYIREGSDDKATATDEAVLGHTPGRSHMRVHALGGHRRQLTLGDPKQLTAGPLSAKDRKKTDPKYKLDSDVGPAAQTTRRSSQWARGTLTSGTISFRQMQKQ